MSKNYEASDCAPRINIINSACSLVAYIMRFTFCDHYQVIVPPLNLLFHGVLVNVVNPVKSKIVCIILKEFNACLKENDILHHYEDQLVNVV
jgi:hypothetical protein